MPAGVLSLEYVTIEIVRDHKDVSISLWLCFFARYFAFCLLLKS